jgi:hypothetical protein
MVSFTLRPLYPREKAPIPLDRRLGGPQRRSGRRGEEKILDLTGTRTPTPRSSSLQPVAIPTTLSRLLKNYHHNYHHHHHRHRFEAVRVLVGMGERRSEYRFFVGKFFGNRFYGRLRKRWNMKSDFSELCCGEKTYRGSWLVISCLWFGPSDYTARDLVCCSIRGTR